MKPTGIGRSNVRSRQPSLRPPPGSPHDPAARDRLMSAEAGRADQSAVADRPGPMSAIKARRAAHFLLPARPQAAGLARRVTGQVLTSWQLGSLRESADLIVSELVANVIRHARADGTAVGLRLQTGDTGMRIEVHDSDPHLPQPRIPAALDESGLGFTIIEATADRWGVRKTDAGKAVWAELDTGLGQCFAIPMHPLRSEDLGCHLCDHRGGRADHGAYRRRDHRRGSQLRSAQRRLGRHCALADAALSAPLRSAAAAIWVRADLPRRDQIIDWCAQASPFIAPASSGGDHAMVASRQEEIVELARRPTCTAIGGRKSPPVRTEMAECMNDVVAGSDGSRPVRSAAVRWSAVGASRLDLRPGESRLRRSSPGSLEDL
jgi:anti-sigma regulatory factor (Ser/Thr protein kinase)